MMSSDGFRNIVDQVYQKVGMLILWNQGEPYLNPEFPQMVRYAANKGLYTMCSTNASLVIDPRAVIESGLNKLIVSMDGISEDTYNSYRINGDYNLVLNNLRALVEAKRSLGKTYPKIIWQFIVMRHNEHEIEAVKLTAKEMEWINWSLKPCRSTMMKISVFYPRITSSVDTKPMARALN